MNKEELQKAIELTQDGRSLKDGHPISDILIWALSDEEIDLVLGNIEYAIDQLQNAKSVVKLIKHTASERL